MYKTRSKSVLSPSIQHPNSFTTSFNSPYENTESMSENSEHYLYITTFAFLTLLKILQKIEILPKGTWFS